MLNTLRSLFRPPRPAGEPRLLRRFGPHDTPISSDRVSVDEGGWRLDFGGPGTMRLFELPDPGVEKCMLTYRAQMKSSQIEGGAYLEMWCRMPGMGEFFSKNLHSKLKGTSSWASYEVPFYLKEGQRPDLLKLNVVSEGRGSVWVKDVEVFSTPLA